MSQQKDTELLVYNQIRHLKKVEAEIRIKLPYGDARGDLMLDIFSMEKELRARFGNDRKLDYLLSLK